MIVPHATHMQFPEHPSTRRVRHENIRHAHIHTYIYILGAYLTSESSSVSDFTHTLTHTMYVYI